MARWHVKDAGATRPTVRHAIAGGSSPIVPICPPIHPANWAIPGRRAVVGGHTSGTQPEGVTEKRLGPSGESSSRGGEPFGQGAAPCAISHRPMAASRSSAYGVSGFQNDLVRSTSTRWPSGNSSSTSSQPGTKYRSRSAFEILMPYPAPELLGLPLCHPLACTAPSYRPANTAVTP